METFGRMSRDSLKPSQISSSEDCLRNIGSFEFANGDKYEGQYLVIKQQLSIVRDGHGTYRTNQSEYTGKWNKDILEKADQITFPDRSTFTGTLDNMTMEGPGVYRFKQGIEIGGNLQNNHFVGDIELKDPNGHCWRALNPKNEDEILFSPVQPFWHSVLNINSSLLPYNNAPSETD